MIRAISSLILLGRLIYDQWEGIEDICNGKDLLNLVFHFKKNKMLEKVIYNIIIRDYKLKLFMKYLVSHLQSGGYYLLKLEGFIINTKQLRIFK
jgi:hypothetical protein